MSTVAALLLSKQIHIPRIGPFAAVIKLIEMVVIVMILGSLWALASMALDRLLTVMMTGKMHLSKLGL